jgi:hypothetical protein
VDTASYLSLPLVIPLVIADGPTLFETAPEAGIHLPHELVLLNLLPRLPLKTQREMAFAL